MEKITTGPHSARKCKKTQRMVPGLTDAGDANNIVYYVRTDDTIERVAAQFCMTPTTLMSLNKLHSRTLFINQKLKVTRPSKCDNKYHTQLTNEVKGDSELNIKHSKTTDTTSLLPLHNKDKHLKVVSKYITDSEGIINGKLLLTTAFFTFIPAFSDPVVMEYGDENYTIHLPNNKIECVSMFNDAEIMLYKRSQRTDMVNKILSPPEQREWLSLTSNVSHCNNDKRESALKDYSLSKSLNEFLNRSDYVHDIEKLKNDRFIDHKYVCVVASPRYRKIQTVYQKEDEYWFMVPTDCAQIMMDYFLTQAQTLHDAGVDVDYNADGLSDRTHPDIIPGQMIKRNSFAKIDDIDGPIKKMKTLFENELKNLRKKSIQWEIVNTDIDFKLDLNDESEDVDSKIIDSAKVKELMKHLPAETIGANWELIYTTDRDGWSLATLYRNVYNSTRGCCLLLIKDSNSMVFGALCNSYIRMSSSFYGNGTSFVFRWNPHFEKFSYSHKNYFLLYGQPDFFSIGCSNTKNAIRIEKNLFSGITQACDTFDSPPLVNSESFDVSHLEIWSFY